MSVSRRWLIWSDSQNPADYLTALMGVGELGRECPPLASLNEEKMSQTLQSVTKMSEICDRQQLISQERAIYMLLALLAFANTEEAMNWLRSFFDASLLLEAAA